MDGFCNQNADQLGSLAGLSFPAVYVGDSVSDCVCHDGTAFEPRAASHVCTPCGPAQVCRGGVATSCAPGSLNANFRCVCAAGSYCVLCGGRYGLGGVVLLFILRSRLGGVGPVRGLRGGERGEWCEECARSG